MTAARNLTDADVEAIVDGLAKRLRGRAPAVERANEAPLTAEDRAEIAAKVRARSKRIGLRSRAGGRCGGWFDLTPAEVIDRVTLAAEGKEAGHG